MLDSMILTILLWAAAAFIGVIGLGVLYVLLLYIADVTQTKQTIRRNFPVIGRFRYSFEHMGEFFRQYFFSMDREEMPFNRAERSWVYRAAKNVDSTIAFGSTRSLTNAGEVMFLSCPFPTLTEDVALPKTITIGDGYAKNPYKTNSLFNVSGMSFGAISK
jgi:glutamate synthase domain-containing protein 2